MAGGRQPGVIGFHPDMEAIDEGTLALTRHHPPGTIGVDGQTGLTRQELERLKRDSVLDIGQLILDITGIIDPTPVSDGTNALISLTRGRWFDAFVSGVSILPYLGDLAKSSKLPGYLRSIRNAVRIARTDPKWALRLQDLFVKLKKVIDNAYELGVGKLPDSILREIKQIKWEIDDFLHSGSHSISSHKAHAVSDMPSTKPKRRRPAETPSQTHNQGGPGPSGSHKPQVKKKTSTASLSAAEANAPHLAKGNLPPYAEGTRARDIVLQKERVFVRVHGEGNQARAWMMRSDEIKGLSSRQIKDKFALPELPTFMSDVHVPVNTKIRVGTVGAQPSWGSGGSIQYELLQRLPSSAFQNMRPLP